MINFLINQAKKSIAEILYKLIIQFDKTIE